MTDKEREDVIVGMAKLQQNMLHVRKDLDEFRTEVRKHLCNVATITEIKQPCRMYFVSREEFEPLKNAYELFNKLLLSAVLGGLLALLLQHGNLL